MHWVILVSRRPHLASKRKRAFWKKRLKAKTGILGARFKASKGKVPATVIIRNCSILRGWGGLGNKVMFSREHIRKPH